MTKMPLYLSEPGLICAAGDSVDSLWKSVTTGDQNGIKQVTACSGKKFFAARINDNLLPSSSARYDMRIMRIEEQALIRMEKSITAAKEKYGAERIAVCVGSCDNGTEFSVAGHRRYFTENTFPSDYSLEIQSADYVATFISEKYGLKGTSLAFSTACSSSAGSIIKAAELIRSGIADAVVAGGVDIASDTVLLGFDSLEAVSSEITNPFSRNRHGITLGEGAAFFVLSKDKLDELHPAVKLLGYGESADAYHMTSPNPNGEGAERAMRAALKNAELEPKDIDYVNMHGTGTKFNDSMEAKAVASVFSLLNVPVSTTKPLTGHTLGAAGALEAAICYTAIIKNSEAGRKQLPLQVWDGEQDNEMPVLNIVDSRSAEKFNGNVRICMSNSFAFGGSNASLIIGE